MRPTPTTGCASPAPNWDVPKHRGLTWFAVRCDAPGVTVQPIREISGGEDFCQEFFDDVELSDDDVIGEVNNGWAVTQTMLVYERGAAPAGGRRWRCGLMAMRPAKRQLAPDLVELAQRVGRVQDPHGAPAHRARPHQRLRTRAARSAGRSAHRARVANPAGIASYGKLAAGVLDPIRARIGVEVGPHGGAALGARRRRRDVARRSTT